MRIRSKNLASGRDTVQPERYRVRPGKRTAAAIRQPPLVVNARRHARRRDRSPGNLTFDSSGSLALGSATDAA